MFNAAQSNGAISATALLSAIEEDMRIQLGDTSGIDCIPSEQEGAGVSLDTYNRQSKLQTFETRSDSLELIATDPILTMLAHQSNQSHSAIQSC